MLILSRRVGEQIQIGENVTITVCRIGDDLVRIGIDAPGEIKIVRAEVAKRRASEANKASSLAVAVDGIFD